MARISTLWQSSDGRPVVDGAHPGVPPGFFADPDSADAADVTTVADIARMVRTSTFAAGTSATDVRRFARTSAATLAWLDTIPGDSGTQADIRLHLELVRASDSSVIWRGDSLSMRTLDSSGVEGMVSIPAHLYAGPSDQVFVRMVTEVPTAMQYDLSTCFAFMDDTTAGAAAKRVAEPVPTPATDTLRTPSLTAWLIPQPARDECTLFIQSASTGEARVAVFDLLGNQATSTIRIAVAEGVATACPIDTRGLPDGSYLLRLTIDGVVHSVRVNVRR